MGLACLGSLLASSADPLRLRIHDDGSLTAEDHVRLTEGLGDVEIVSRGDADERVAAHCAAYPATREFRRANPLALKLIDAVLLEAGEDLAYCDSDVLFLRPFRGLFAFPAPVVGAIFMADTQNAYSLRSWHLLPHPGLRLAARVNSGVILYRTTLYDPELLEWFLVRGELRRTPAWEEQTGWALLAGRTETHWFDPRRLRLAGAQEAIDPEVVALHFVSSRRDRLGPCRAAAPDRSREEPVELRTVSASRATPLGLAASELRRLAARW
jgi:hypothetical protein